MKRYLILIMIICLCFTLTSCNEGEFECVVNEAYYINQNDAKVNILNGNKIDIDKIKDNIVYVTFRSCYTAEGLFKNLLPDVKVGNPLYKIYYDGELIKDVKPTFFVTLPAQYEHVFGITYEVAENNTIKVQITDTGKYKVWFSPNFSAVNVDENAEYTFTIK